MVAEIDGSTVILELASICCGSGGCNDVSPNSFKVPSEGTLKLDWASNFSLAAARAAAAAAAFTAFMAARKDSGVNSSHNCNTVFLSFEGITKLYSVTQ